MEEKRERESKRVILKSKNDGEREEERKIVCERVRDRE